MRPVALFVVLLASSCYAQFTGNSCTTENNTTTTTISCVLNGAAAGNKVMAFYTINTNIGSTCGATCISDSLGDSYVRYCIGGSGSCGQSWGYQFGDSLGSGTCASGVFGFGVTPCTTNLNIATLGSSGNVTVSLPNNGLYAYLIVMEYASVGSNDASAAWCAGDAIFCPTRQATGSQSTSVVTTGNPDVIINFAACIDQCTATPTPGGSYVSRLTYTAPFTDPGSGGRMRITVSDRHLLPSSTYTVDDDIGGTGTAAAIIGWSFGDNTSTGLSGDAQIL